MALSIDILRSPGLFAFAAKNVFLGGGAEGGFVTIPRIPDRQATKSHIPCPNFGQSRFPGSSQIPNPVKISFVFPNPAPYLFGEIPDPENTLPDPALIKRMEKISFLSKVLVIAVSFPATCSRLYDSVERIHNQSGQ